MVDSHTIAVGTVTLMGVALFIRSIAAVLNATSRLIQAASLLTKMIVTFILKNHQVDIPQIFLKTLRIHAACIDFLKNHQVVISFLKTPLCLILDDRLRFQKNSD
jgi:hypothetical protein